MKVKPELIVEKSLSLGVELYWDKRLLPIGGVFFIGVGFLCFTLFIHIIKGKNDLI